VKVRPLNVPRHRTRRPFVRKVSLARRRPAGRMDHGNRLISSAMQCTDEARAPVTRTRSPLCHGANLRGREGDLVRGGATSADDAEPIRASQSLRTRVRLRSEPVTAHSDPRRNEITNDPEWQLTSAILPACLEVSDRELDGRSTCVRRHEMPPLEATAVDVGKSQ